MVSGRMRRRRKWQASMVTLRNEQDVREEIATPFLKALGYESGTENDIVREPRLRYAAMQLGRKKSTDMPIPQGGDADYLLTVAGIGRWILETKPPDQEITRDDVDQTASYARHPEISGHYAAILNGRRFILYSSSQTSNDKPILEVEVTTAEELAKMMQGLLSPAAIRRDYTPRIVDLRMPLAAGYRGEATITGGWNKQLIHRLETALPIPPPVRAQMEAQQAKFIGMQSTVRGGRIWRDDASRIRARLSWNSPHVDMQPVLEAAHLDDFEYVCLNETISNDPGAPSVFDVVAAFQFREGQVSYDLLRWETKILNFSADVVVNGQAAGYLQDDQFRGVANFREIASIRGVLYPLIVHFVTEFCFTVDQR